MSSKYDFVKIKVQLQEENYFILSRFLLSKMLLFCQVPPSVAVRVSLDVKKHFVDAGEHQISEQQLRQQLFSTLKAHGCGDSYITLYQRISEFQTARVPIIVFIAGTGCCGKSSIAHMLGSKLSNFHIVNTNLVLDTLYAISLVDRGASSLPDGSSFFSVDGDAGGEGGGEVEIPFPSCQHPFLDHVGGGGDDDVSAAGVGGGNSFAATGRSSGGVSDKSSAQTAGHLGFWVRHAIRRRRSFRRDPATCQLLPDGEDNDAVVQEWKEACSMVAGSVQGEIRKALREGKALIVEGTFINLVDYASYITPGALEQTMSELRGGQKRGKSRGRPIVLSSLMQLPREVPPMVLRLWIQEQLHEQRFPISDTPRHALQPQLQPPASVHLHGIPIAASGCGSLDADSEIVLPPVAYSASVIDDLPDPALVDGTDLTTLSEGVEELLRVVETAHMTDVSMFVSSDGSERLGDFVTKEVFDIRRTADVGAHLHEELLRRICSELDRQQRAAATAS